MFADNLHKNQTHKLFESGNSQKMTCRLSLVRIRHVGLPHGKKNRSDECSGWYSEQEMRRMA